MNRLLIFSLLVLFAQTRVSAEDQTHNSVQWDPNKVIHSWGTDKRAEESFDASLAAIKRELEKSDTLDMKKLTLLSDWVEKLSNAQQVLLKRAEDWQKDPTLTDKSRDNLLNRKVLYNERIEKLEKLKSDIQKGVELEKEEEKHQKDLEWKLEKLKQQMLKDLKWA